MSLHCQNLCEESHRSLLPGAKNRTCISYPEPMLHYFIAWKLAVFSHKSLHCRCALLKIKKNVNDSISKTKRDIQKISTDLNSLCSILYTVKFGNPGRSNNHASLKKLKNIQTRLSSLSFILQRNKKSGILFLLFWTFPAIFSEIGQKKWLSALMG